MSCVFANLSSLRLTVRVASMVLVLFGAARAHAAGAPAGKPKAVSLPVDRAVVHRPPHFTDREQFAALPVGVAVVAEVPAAPKDLAAAFAAAVKREKVELSAGKLHILSTGPMLDGPDKVLVRSLTREGNRLKLLVVHTNVRRLGAELRRNIPWRPMIQVPVELPPGTYLLEATWEALAELPNGKPLAGKPQVLTTSFKVAAGNKTR